MAGQGRAGGDTGVGHAVGKVVVVVEVHVSILVAQVDDYVDIQRRRQIVVGKIQRTARGTVLGAVRFAAVVRVRLGGVRCALERLAVRQTVDVRVRPIVRGHQVGPIMHLPGSGPPTVRDHLTGRLAGFAAGKRQEHACSVRFRTRFRPFGGELGGVARWAFWQ
ncbi:MAG: hypothetical protein ACYSVY_09990 [Planctomycetota bacterium]